MNKPIAFCLFTSEKGHFGIKNRYLQTIQDFNQKLQLKKFDFIIANVKYEEECDTLWEINQNLKNYGFKVNLAKGEKWSHGQQSHQNEYLEDMWRIYSNQEILQHQYIIHVEDDWLFNIKFKNLEHWINTSIDILDKNPNINQVRFARFQNEFDRINNLKKKHNLDRNAEWVNSDWVKHDDFSCNPSVFRSRDLFLALSLMRNNPNSFVSHVEHGLGFAMKVLSGYNNRLPFAILNPENISVRHIGCPDKDIDPETGVFAEIV